MSFTERIHMHAGGTLWLPCVDIFSCPYSAEIDQKLQEIMKQTGYLKIDGQVKHPPTHTNRQAFNLFNLQS